MISTSFPVEQIGEFAQKVTSWNPKREGNEQQITYIDLGAVNNERKTINGLQRIPANEAPSRARQLVQAGDILVSTVRPNLNGVARVPENLDGATASTGFCVLRPDPNRLQPSYLFHWVRSSAFIADMIRQATGQSYPAVSDKIIFKSEIPLPPLEEQKRIAAILDQTDLLRRLRQQALDKLNTLGQSIFYEMFGDPASPYSEFPKAKLSAVAKLINGDRSSNYPSGNDIVEEGILFLNSKNIKGFTLDLTGCNYITEEKFQSLTRGKLERHDLIITLRGTLGQCAEFDCEYETGFINAQMMIIRASDQHTPSFLRSFISHSRTQARLQQSRSGSAVPQLTAKQIGELEISIPPIEKQREYDAKLSEIRSLKTPYILGLRKLEDGFSSLQQRAFRGEL